MSSCFYFYFANSFHIKYSIHIYGTPAIHEHEMHDTFDVSMVRLTSLVSGRVEYVDGSQLYGCSVEDVKNRWINGKTLTGQNGMYVYCTLSL